MYHEVIKVPKERIAVLIGKKGSVRKKIEEIFNVKLTINSEEGLVKIESDDSLSLFESVPAIKAIARGFNPKVIEKLKSEEFFLEILNIEDYVGKSKKAVIRIKARLIGTDGKARKELELMTNTNISVYGKTVSILGKYDNVKLAKEGVEELLKGAPHSNAYRYVINKKKKDAERNNF
ncbi:MAG: KH domain-containing protein [Candidatus Nanoarchaeia archaeon]|nr:KH domain-containing protein [Candidatus Nanoarchaeia archaeon]